VSALQLSLTYQFVYLLKVRKTQPLYIKENASSARQQISSGGNAQFKSHFEKKQAFVSFTLKTTSSNWSRSDPNLEEIKNKFVIELQSKTCLRICRVENLFH